jgi:hypothetical protein
MGLYYEWIIIRTRGFSPDINGMIFIAFMLGLIFHAAHPLCARLQRGGAHGRPHPPHPSMAGLWG